MGNKASELLSMVARADAAPVLMVGAHNALAGRLAEQNGFGACWISSFEVSATLGLPDQNLIGCGEMGAVTRSISVATELPIVVDADNGYGSAAAMARAARELASCGAAAMCVEDSVFPKCNSFDPRRGHEIEDAVEFARRIGTTRQAMRGQPLALIARTEALIASMNVAEALTRAMRYADAGADMVILHTKDRTGEQAIEVANRWDRPTPLVTIPTAFPHLGPAELHRAGYRVIVYANYLLRAAVQGMEHSLRLLRSGQATEIDGQVVSMPYLFDLTEQTLTGEGGPVDQRPGNQRERKSSDHSRRTHSAGAL